MLDVLDSEFPKIKIGMRFYKIKDDFRSPPIIPHLFKWSDWEILWARTLRSYYHKPHVLMWKLLLPLIVPNDVDKMIFFDSDVYIRAPLRDLWVRDISCWKQRSLNYRTHCWYLLKIFLRKNLEELRYWSLF